MYAQFRTTMTYPIFSDYWDLASGNINLKSYSHFTSNKENIGKFYIRRYLDFTKRNHSKGLWAALSWAALSLKAETLLAFFLKPTKTKVDTANGFQNGQFKLAMTVLSIFNLILMFWLSLILRNNSRLSE